MEKLLTETIANLDSLFSKNELAYLALTTKIELPIRDKWAFKLYETLNPENIVVSREWRRTDLAIIEDNSPKVLIELKAMYTFDAFFKQEDISGYAEKLFCDIKKSKDLCMKVYEEEVQKTKEKGIEVEKRDTQIYSVLLATHPKGIIDKKMARVIKYSSAINRSLKEHSEKQVKDIANKAVLRNLGNHEIITYGELDAGEAFGVKTSVLYWIIKA